MFLDCKAKYSIHLKMKTLANFVQWKPTVSILKPAPESKMDAEVGAAETWDATNSVHKQAQIKHNDILINIPN